MNNNEATHEMYEQLGQDVLSGKIDIGTAAIVSGEQMEEFANYRTKTELKHLRRVINFKDKKLLDLGCGPGRLSFEFAKKCKYVLGIDYSNSFIEIAKNNNKFENCDFKVGSTTNFSCNEKFDIVFIGGVILYLSDKEAIQCIKNITDNYLENNGIIICREPIKYSKKSGRTNLEYLKMFSDSGLKNIYNKPTFLICPIYRFYKKCSEQKRKNSFYNQLFKILFNINCFFDPFFLKFSKIYEKYFSKNWTIKQRFYIFKHSEDE